MKPVFLFDHPLFRDHDPGRGHPECPDRLDAIASGIQRRGLVEQVEWVRPSPAKTEDLLRVHTAAHVGRMLSLKNEHDAIDSDTVVSPLSVDAALVGAGACIEAVDLVLENRAAAAFCLSRPPGHHAESNRAMGFCLFNNVAIAAAYAIAEKGVKRVFIFDPDVHHGNGTQEIFYERGDVCYLSIHQSPLFPGTGRLDELGEGEGKGCNVNIPLPPGMGDSEYGYIVEEVALPLVRAFSPELVIFSAGFDAHIDDPLGGMDVTLNGFVNVYSLILRELVANAIPALFCLEGGYSLTALEETVPAVIDLLVQGPPGSLAPYGEPHPIAQRVVAELKGLQSE